MQWNAPVNTLYIGWDQSGMLDARGEDYWWLHNQCGRFKPKLFPQISVIIWIGYFSGMLLCPENNRWDFEWVFFFRAIWEKLCTSDQMLFFFNLPVHLLLINPSWKFLTSVQQEARMQRVNLCCESADKTNSFGLIYPGAQLKADQ